MEEAAGLIDGFLFALWCRMRPKAGMKLHGWLLAGSVLLAGCAAPPRLSCEVDLREAAGGAARVACTADNLPDEPIVIKQMAQSFLLRVEGFTVATADGRKLPVETRPDQSMGSDARLFAERVVHAPDRKGLTYSYQVRPGAWMG